MKKFKPEIRRVSLKKNLLDYLFDFFMLFLAVTLGFFSNNLREDIINHKTEKEYIVKLISDVERDTSDLRQLLQKERTQLFGIDTLLQAFEKNNLQPPEEDLYRLIMKYLSYYNGFQPRSITFNQLKYAGDLNLIGDRTVLDSIIYYYDRISAYDDQGRYNQEYFTKVIDQEMEMLDYSVFRVPGKKKTLRNKDHLPLFYNNILTVGNFISQDRLWQKQVAANAQRLLELLHEKYSL